MTDWQTIIAIDFDRWAVETYRANFPVVEVRCAKVGDEMGRLPSADVILGGPPCQPHSHAGKRRASKDERDCGPDFVAAVARVKPRMFLMENVEGLLSSEGGRYAQRLHRALEDAGYVVEVKVQDAVQFGVPQFRVRCWWWGIRADLYRDGVRHAWPKPTHAWPPPEPGLFGAGANLLPGVTVGQALGLDGYICRGGRGQGITERHGDRPPAPTTEPGPTVANGENGSSRMFIQSHAGPAPTVQAKYFKGGAEGLLDVTGAKWKRKGDLWVRRLTPLECLRLQSGPDDFRWPEGISKTAMYRIIGNGIACGHAAAFSRAFAAADPDARTVIDLFCGGGLGAVGWHQRYWAHAAKQEQSLFEVVA